MNNGNKLHHVDFYIKKDDDPTIHMSLGYDRIEELKIKIREFYNRIGATMK